MGEMDAGRVALDLHAAGIPADGEQAALLVRYAALVLEKNTVMNLTAITEARDFEVRHLLDSAAPLTLPELEGSLIDIGTGAGFPGVVLKILKPELAVTLLDSTAKKLRFVEEACRELGIEVATVHARAEEVRRSPLVGAFDIAVARAVAPLPKLVPTCFPFLRPGGLLVAMKSDAAAEELRDAEKAMKKARARLARVEEYTLPGAGGRTLVLLRKDGYSRERLVGDGPAAAAEDRLGN